MFDHLGTKVVSCTLGLGLAATLALSACNTESAPAAREAPKRTMAPEEPEPQPEAIDQRRIQDSSMVVEEAEPAPMPDEEKPMDDEKADMDPEDGHDHDEPAEAGGDAAEKPATMAATTKSVAPPVKKPKSLIR